MSTIRKKQALGKLIIQISPILRAAFTGQANRRYHTLKSAMSLYPPTGQKTESSQPTSPTPGKKSPLFPKFRRFSRAKAVRRKVRNSTVATDHPAASSCSSSASERSSLSEADADHDHVSAASGRGDRETHSPLRSSISPQTQASMDNVFR